MVKIDLLGIRGLTVLGRSPSDQSWQRSRGASRLEVLETIPEDDPETANTVEYGRTIGCFQIESPGMRATFSAICAPASVDDIMAALALYRPGPLQGGLKDTLSSAASGARSPSSTSTRRWAALRIPTG